MKTYRWRIPDGDAEHTVSCALFRLRGKLRVAVDGDEFDLPAGLFGLSVARREKLLLGEQKALRLSSVVPPSGYRKRITRVKKGAAHGRFCPPAPAQ